MTGQELDALPIVAAALRRCDGKGTCAASRLLARQAKCVKCRGRSFDHETDKPQEAFCVDCGEPASEVLQWGPVEVIS